MTDRDPFDLFLLIFTVVMGVTGTLLSIYSIIAHVGFERLILAILMIFVAFITGLNMTTRELIREVHSQ